MNIFLDEQRVGPHRYWYHEHTFQPLKNGGKMTDHVTYVAPFGFLGDIVHAIWLRQRLKTIFGFRRQKISEIFGSAK
jgi:ligand-binding SRPBCC domain-containing protein